MSNNFIDKALNRGEASVRTFTFGGSAVGNIEVQKNKFIIIKKFDWFNFIDIIDNNGERGTATYEFTDLAQNYISIMWDGFPLILDSNNLDQTTIDVNNLIQTVIYPPDGYSSNVTWNNGKFIFKIYSTKDNQANGYIPTIEAPITTIYNTPPIVGAQSNTITPNSVRDLQNKMLEFRSLKSSNSFAIVQDVQEYVTFRNSNFIPAISCTGKYVKECYLVHESDVSINIWTIPVSATWGGSFGALANATGQSRPPLGYGTTQTPPGVGNLKNILFNAINEQYIPYGQANTDVLIQNNRQQFRPDIIDSRKLNNPISMPPTTEFIFIGNRYPLINIEYYEFDRPYSYYLKSSN